VIEAHVPRLIAACDDDARRFGCNAVVVGKSVVVNAGCERLTADLCQRGYHVAAVELDEFIKSGGSAKCLTLRLDGEEAAAW
jgi:N-dimethylarginine dimethylaminohydrolase